MYKLKSCIALRGKRNLQARTFDWIQFFFAKHWLINNLNGSCMPRHSFVKYCHNYEIKQIFLDIENFKEMFKQRF